MKQVLIFLLIVISLFAWGAQAEEEGYYVLCRPESMVNVRSRPKKNAPVVGWVAFGTFVKTDGKEKNGFVHVIDLAAEEPEGWIYAGFLTWDKPRDEKYSAVVWGGRLIARSCIDGKQVCVLREGKTVTVYARCNQWAVTDKGYVMCDYLRVAE